MKPAVPVSSNGGAPKRPTADIPARSDDTYSHLERPTANIPARSDDTYSHLVRGLNVSPAMVGSSHSSSSGDNARLDRERTDSGNQNYDRLE